MTRSRGSNVPSASMREEKARASVTTASTCVGGPPRPPPGTPEPPPGPPGPPPGPPGRPPAICGASLLSPPLFSAAKAMPPTASTPAATAPMISCFLVSAIMTATPPPSPYYTSMPQSPFLRPLTGTVLLRGSDGIPSAARRRDLHKDDDVSAMTGPEWRFTSRRLYPQAGAMGPGLKFGQRAGERQTNPRFSLP